jgi:hypothetical protein
MVEGPTIRYTMVESIRSGGPFRSQKLGIVIVHGYGLHVVHANSFVRVKPIGWVRVGVRRPQIA